MPWSGNERNHLYFGGVPGFFQDYSGISGIDDPGDGRSFSVLDYDLDGRQDIALASPGSPRFRLLRNGIGERVGADNGYIAVRFVGGNHSASASTDWSARDGFGTAVTLDLHGLTVFREHQPESGFVGQNSTTMILGMGKHSDATRMDVRWLSGRTQTLENVKARKLVTVYENPAQSPTGAKRRHSACRNCETSNDFTKFIKGSPSATLPARKSDRRCSKISPATLRNT